MEKPESKSETVPCEVCLAYFSAKKPLYETRLGVTERAARGKLYTNGRKSQKVTK